MVTVIFDQLELVEMLIEAGVPEKQAKAISTVVQKSHEAAGRAYTSVLQGDLEKLEYAMSAKHDALRQQIGDLRRDMQHTIKELESRLTLKLGSIVVAALGAFALLTKFLSFS